ncbi:ABC transporter, periplasmic substrate-binding protein [Syntrophotalea carbinolica DSM 2380]|uniref:ABC transporter, periplasmic substrate-binding protein n=1 Tax=Syntrophotalea carbinolica (strain DSM 2380 / NBRC 103641 / GraBd1) TaxID=338963 RepID=Q3A1F0_SYNC1|nr:ABC transporter, periplasmic substrate-binding protein [Syntrophotalea carbinolica DSM 2380]
MQYRCGWGGLTWKKMRCVCAAMVGLLVVLLNAGWLAAEEPDKRQRFAGKKVLWVDSYHAGGYEWTAGIERGIRKALRGTGVQVRILRMNTKWDLSENSKQHAGLKAKQAIDAWRPDVVIASDDNAARYLVVPYLKNTSLPVVFCGINWDASPYGFPCSNVTGMIEVEPVETLVAHLRRFAKGERLGYLSADTVSERKVVDVYNRRFFSGSMKSYLARDFDHFKELFLRAQNEVDMIYIANYSDMPGWDSRKVEDFLVRHVRKPTGSRLAYMERFVTFTVAKVPEEQGEYAAKTALKILGGISPDAIPVVANELASLTINLKMAKASGIVLPVSTLQVASKVIGQEAYR